MPAAITCETASPAASVRREAGQQRAHGLGDAEHAHGDPDGDPERALGADEDAEQVGPVVVARERHELAARQHDVGGEHVVDGEAVLEAVRAARVLGDVAADRADLLARRVGRVEEAGSPATAFVISRFVTPGSTTTRPRSRSTSSDPVHARERDHDAVGDRQRAAGEPGARAARDERHADGRGRARRPPATSSAEPGSTTSSGTPGGRSARRTRRCAAARARRSQPRRAAHGRSPLGMPV